MHIWDRIRKQYGIRDKKDIWFNVIIRTEYRKYTKEVKSMSNYEIAIFDVDGTLLNTTEGIVASAKYTIDKMGFKPLDDEQLLAFIGPPIQDSFAEAYHLEGEILQKIATCFRDHYKDHELFKAMPYDGIYDLLDELSGRGVKLAVATYKRQDCVETLLRHFGFDKYTSIICGADHENKLKKVDIIRQCMDALGEHDYSKAVMIGDSSNDAVGACKTGMDFIGVTYGFGFKSLPEVFELRAVGASDSPEGILQFFD